MTCIKTKTSGIMLKSAACGARAAALAVAANVACGGASAQLAGEVCIRRGTAEFPVDDHPAANREAYRKEGYRGLEVPAD